MATFFAELTAAKQDLEAWRKSLPAYYESILIPITDPQTFDHPEALEKYPYNERLDYVTGTRIVIWCLILGFIGHTMCLYRAAILQIDRHLLSHMFPNARPSESEMTYHLIYITFNL
jgi:hypothetical protein